MKKLNKRGFTLTEMIVVIAIIGILAAVLIPSVIIYVQKAQLSNDQQLAASMTDEIERYCIENNVDQEDLLGTDVKTILFFKDFDLNPSRNKWTYVYNSAERRVEVIELDDIAIDASHDYIDPTNYKEGYYIIGAGKSTMEQAINILCNVITQASYDEALELADGDSVEYIVQYFTPENTVYVSNSTWFTNGETITKIVYLLKTIHLPSAENISFDPSASKYKSAIIKTCDDNSQFKEQLFTRLKYIDLDEVKEIKIEISEPEKETDVVTPSITFDSLVNDAKDISITTDIVKIEQFEDKAGNEKISLTRKVVITYYDETGVYARGIAYFNFVQDKANSSENQ